MHVRAGGTLITTSASADYTGHLDALHGLRGVAACLVLVGHFSGFGGPILAPGNHLAVDLFFVLSGFVIAHAYDARLAGGMSFGAFFLARLKRLYPLYLLALVVAVISVVGLDRFGITNGFSRAALLGTFGANLLFLPAAPALSLNSSLLFPLDGPAWSLFWELLANAFFAAIFPWLGKRQLQIMILLGAVGVAITTWHFGTGGGGAYWRQLPAGGARVVFSFFLGVYLRRFHYAAAAPRPALFAGISVLVVALMAAAPSPSWRWALDLVAILAVWPALILAASRISLGGVTQRVSHVSGELSYAVYVLHMPIIKLLTSLWAWRSGVAANALSDSGLLSIGIAVIALAAFAHYQYDVPVRRAMSQRRTRKPDHSVTQF